MRSFGKHGTFSVMKGFAIFGLLVMLAGCNRAAEPVSPHPRPSTFVTVIDGDTLSVRGKAFHIEGIDAPNLPPHARCWSEAALAVQAANMVSDHIAGMDRLVMGDYGEDRFGRTIGRVITRSGQTLGDALVAAGVAAQTEDQTWDWCGRPDLADSNGPFITNAAVKSDDYSKWVLDTWDEQERRATPTIVE